MIYSHWVTSLLSLRTPSGAETARRDGRWSAPGLTEIDQQRFGAAAPGRASPHLPPRPPPPGQPRPLDVGRGGAGTDPTGPPPERDGRAHFEVRRGPGGGRAGPRDQEAAPPRGAAGQTKGARPPGLEGATQAETGARRGPGKTRQPRAPAPARFPARFPTPRLVPSVLPGPPLSSWLPAPRLVPRALGPLRPGSPSHIWPPSAPSVSPRSDPRRPVWFSAPRPPPAPRMPRCARAPGAPPCPTLRALRAPAGSPRLSRPHSPAPGALSPE